MAALTITAASVLAGSNAATVAGVAGATITAGQVVYKEASTGKYKLADANDATAEVRVPAGIALHGASDGQPLKILTGGNITIGATVTAGTAYYLSPLTAGGIGPLADVTTGDDVVLVGIATTAAIIKVQFLVSGVTL